MASVTDQTVVSGNLILIKIANKVVGRAQSISFDQDYGTEGVYELGSIMPQEHVFLRYDGTITLNRFRVSPAAMNLAKSELEVFGSSVVKQKVFTIVVFDNVHKKVIETYKNVTIVSAQTEFRANEIVAQTATFKALDATGN